MTFPAEFVRPEQGDIRGILPATLRALGARRRDGGSFGDDAATFELPQARRACVVLVDGLGYEQLTQRSGHFPFLRNRQTQRVTTVAPSTTAAAVTAFGTGAAPGLTGMLGYTVRSPEGRLLNLIRWDEGAQAMRQWQSMPTLAEQMERPERFAVFAPARFANSGLTVAALRGAREVAAEELSDRVDAAVAALRSGRTDLAYVYWGEVDHVGHDHGWQSWQWGDEATRTDSELGRLARELPKDTLLVITADHGMVDVDYRIDVAATPALAADVDLVAGEPRASHVFTSRPQDVAARWAEVLGERAWVATRDEASSLFGEVAPRFVGVIGDVVVFMRGQSVVVDSRTQTPASIALQGVHGSLTEAEMAIPLAVELL